MDASDKTPVLPISSFTDADWTKERKEIARWLADRAPSLLEGYKSAVILLYLHGLEARVHLICHLVRDFYFYLPAALGVASSPRPGEVFPSLVLKLRNLWEDNPPIQLDESEPQRVGLQMSSTMHSHLKKMVQKSKDYDNSKTIGARFAAALYQSQDRQSDDFIDPWIIESFESGHKFFISKAHLVDHIDNIPSDDGLIEHFQSFEKSFHSMIGPYFSGKEELDEILQDTNAVTD